jgi:O-antigen ligase
LAVLALTLLAALAATGGIRAGDKPVRVALICLWGFAGWTLASTLWAESPGRALEGSGRTLLYAALVTLGMATIASPRHARRVGALVVAGAGAIAVITLAGLLGDGADEFLAGRLDDPVGYRNATAALFALAFWPLVAVAAQRRLNPAARGAAFGVANLAIGLAFLTQARGVVLGLALGGAVAIGLGPDRLRRAWLALVCAGGVALASGSLLEPYRAFSDGAGATAADIDSAVSALVLLTVAATAVGVLGALFDGGLRIEDPTRAAGRRVGAGALVAATTIAVVAALVRIGDPVEFVDARIDEFRGLETAAPGETRLTFGGGQRSDLWRVSLVEFGERPVTGVGEGSYPFGYYEERDTDRNLSTPHSLAFSVLAELGAVGTLLTLGFLAAIAAALRSRWNAAPRGRWWASALAAAGVVVLAQALVDWIWLVPGVMGLGLLCLALAVSSLRPEADPPPQPAPPAARAVLATVLALAALGVAALYLSDAQLRKARAEDGAAQSRLDDARAAERLNPWSLPARYHQAGALEELGRAQEARGELHDALELEPRNFVTLGLLGDLELRAGRAGAARAYYGRALELNPLDVGLRELSRRGL